MIVAERARCSWGRFHPDEVCLTRVDGPEGEAGPSGTLVNRYCPTHSAAIWAILDEPVVAARGARGIGKGGDGHRDDSPEAHERKRRHAEALAYVASYSGTWGLPLDIRADRRFGTKYMKLSERQVEVLLIGRDRDAARLIATEVAADDYHAAEYADRDLAEYKLAQSRGMASDPGRRPVVEDGMYRKAGVTYKVQTARESGKRYAKVLDEEAHAFIYTPGAITRLSADDRMTIEDAEAFGQLYGWCCVCGRTLTDERSIARGIGPVCGGRV